VPEQLIFFAIFLLLAVFNLVARWLRGRMQRSAEPPGEEGPRDVPYEARGEPSVRTPPPSRDVPARREAPLPLPPRARVRAPVPLGSTVSPESFPLPPPVSLEERGQAGPLRPAVPSPPTRAVPRRRNRAGLEDRAQLRRGILLRTILGPPRALERPERDGEPR
jgi:hypothetical protein